MDFFDKLGEAARSLTEKAGDSLEINRLNSEIAIEKGNIQCYQRELGEHYLAKFIVGEKLDDEAMLICDKVVVSQDRMRKLMLDIDQVRQEREAVVEERTKLRLQKAEAEVQLAEEGETEASVVVAEPIIIEERKDIWPKFCAQCGGAIKEKQRFCMFCGAEVAEQLVD